MHFCLNCLQAFPTIESRDKHYGYCKDNEAVKITMPSEKKKWLYYKDGQQQFKIPFAIYADFESLLIPMKENARETKTKKLNKHVPCGWCTYSTFAYDDISYPLYRYRGKDCVKMFVQHIEDKRPLSLHGAIQRRCAQSLQPQIQDTRPRAVIFHNLSGYDANLFIRELGEKYDTQNIGCIAENTEKYISFNVKIKVSLRCMGYGDSETYKKIEIRYEMSAMRRYMSGISEHRGRVCGKLLVQDLRLEYHEAARHGEVKANVPAMARFIDGDDFFRLMLRKGVYPYEYMNGWRFKETELPPKEAFYSKLNMKGISDNDYEHAKKVWNFITPKGAEVNMGDYHDLYLVTDCAWSRLESSVEVYRDQAGAPYGPRHAPDVRKRYSWRHNSSCAQICQSQQQVHGEQYDPNEESSYLQYLDANNLYGWTMRQDLPTHGFKWLSIVEAFTQKRISKLVADNKHGYILEVDINYPEKLHDKHNELPFLPERKVVHRVEKLIPNLEHKQRYVVHIRALHQALNHRLELKKVYRVFQFNQKPWLKGYIDHNTELRAAAKNEFEKDFYKLMNLSVFGKTMENLRNHHIIQLVTNEAAYTKLVMKPNFKGGNYFSSHLMGVEMGNTEVKMNKPVTEDFYRDIADDVETRFNTSAYSKDDGRPLPIVKNKNVVGLMKDELNGKIMTEFITLRAKLYAYKSIMKGGGDGKAKGVKKGVTAKSITFEDYVRCLEDSVDIYKTWVCIQNKGHQIYTQEVNKLALNRADDNKIVQPDQITTLARGHYRLVANK
ncbi:uncharacterized protein LOC130648531 [Hydractinia symbiolongicarpus]|uniref:uncharacterized protein LOC130648531 n=1 Tax=Hydractinia symbiolongicarpus TaxID=13093 RepID=UPI00254A96D7|nr:uncharacterized protein LOC130648531 [Hydractinia symbiolongicarpus]